MYLLVRLLKKFFKDICADIGRGDDVDYGRPTGLACEMAELLVQPFLAVGFEICETVCFGKLPERKIDFGGKALLELVEMRGRLDEAEYAAAAVVEHSHFEAWGDLSESQGADVILRAHVAGQQQCHSAEIDVRSDGGRCRSVDAAYTSMLSNAE